MIFVQIHLQVLLREHSLEDHHLLLCLGLPPKDRIDRIAPLDIAIKEGAMEGVVDVVVGGPQMWQIV